MIRAVGRGIKTRAASIANSEQLLQFLGEVSSEVEKQVGTETLKELKGITMLNQKFQRDVSFRGQLQHALLEAGAPVAPKISEADLADRIGDVANAACAASSLAGPLVGAAACGFALGFAIGRLIWG